MEENASTGSRHTTQGAHGRGHCTAAIPAETRPPTQPRTHGNSKAGNSERKMTGSKKRKRGLAPRKAPSIATDCYASKEEPSTPEPRQMESQICALCGEVNPKKLVDLSKNPVMKRTISSLYDMTAQSVERSLRSVCVDCVCKINIHQEVSNSLQIRLHRLTNGQIMNASRVFQRQPLESRQPQTSDAHITLPHSPGTSPRNGFELTAASGAIESTTLSTPDTARALVAGSDVLRLPTPPLTADLSASTTPDTKDKDYNMPAGCSDTPDERELSLTPPPPPYSPVNRRHSCDVENNYNNFLSNKVQNDQECMHNGQLEDEPSGRQRYSVMVEDVSPVKGEVAETTSSVFITSTPMLTRANYEMELGLSRLVSAETNAERPQEQQLHSSLQDNEEQHIQQKAVRQLSPHPAAARLSNSSHSRSSSNQSQCGPNHSMLEVIRVRTESALITESGGTINNYQRARRVPTQLICPHCNRPYWRKDHYAKHMRRCQGRQRHAKALSAISANETNAALSESANGESQAQVQPTRVFRCQDCTLTLANISELRAHKQQHLRHYYCELCGSEFNTEYEHEFHHIVCLAKHEAQEEEQEQGQDAQLNNLNVSHSRTKSKAPTTAGRRVTRALSRAISTHSVNTSAVSTYTVNTTTTAAPRRQRWKSMGMNSSVSQCWRNKRSKINNYDNDNDEGSCDIDDDEEENDVDDAVSVADTMYSKRMRFTVDWVDDQRSTSNSFTSLGDESFIDCDADAQINSYREYDLYLLDRLKAQIHLKSFRCFVPNCSFTTDTLLDIMLHDYVNHFKSSWFYCKKCGHVFTSKVFLDYHLDRQNGGRYICFKCGEFFEFQHQLERHIIRHSKCVNYRCNYCNFEFLSETELLQHCELEQHQPNDDRTLIRIDPEAMIVNQLPPEPVERRKYTVHVLNMRLPKVPSKRPMDLPGHKPYRRHIGAVEFGRQKNPNCWGWE